MDVFGTVYLCPIHVLCPRGRNIRTKRHRRKTPFLLNLWIGEMSQILAKLRILCMNKIKNWIPENCPGELCKPYVHQVNYIHTRLTFFILQVFVSFVSFIFVSYLTCYICYANIYQPHAFYSCSIHFLFMIFFTLCFCQLWIN